MLTSVETATVGTQSDAWDKIRETRIDHTLSEKIVKREKINYIQKDV